LRNEELHNFYVPPNIIRFIKSRSIRWAGHVERMREVRNIYEFWSENLKGRDHCEDPSVDGNIVLEWMLRKWSVDWMSLAQDRDQCSALMKTVMNLRVTQKAGNFLTS
jgi:hypothetical protein